MQDPGEASGGRTGVEEDEDGQQRPRASDIQASSQSSAAEGDQDEVPRESGPQDASSQSVPGRSCPGSPLGLGVAAEEAAVVPQDELPPLLPGPSGDVATTASRLLEFSVRVPFRSAVEADMARRILVANAQRQLLMVPQEYTVNDSTLVVRWTTDDTSLFQISINSFLDQLSLVMRNIRHFQFVAVVKRGRGRIHHT
ncbi:EKC/KEOPS complex subunit LAGE3-like [Arvicola amphibius]|uniref:EKC/KEOPS complex subunit LAGE3-like n=1 Tax=Arvicola amphibius TaxID=1047088 RepID=UPI0018E3E21E|nr:EKC/KEOPS complex subunit LAGE3-like [Arvicola amphibius]